ncbi:hypothetical protein AQUSIP_16300 [Aquicella siphonis]|uniref:Uncharacterized protein n=1 Tax=Aquicella siphonis TaxID=254247 RepID=A0A5E4PH49_9COXI|nr:hypothetical protein AQUSIP_16300 [Aquicella siphonis]
MLLHDNFLLDHIPGHIGWKDVDRVYQGANKALLEFKGVKYPNDITGKTDEEISPPPLKRIECF